LSRQPGPYQQGARVRLAPHERTVQLGGIFTIAFGQNLRPKGFAHFAAEDAAVPEAREGVGVQVIFSFVHIA
jgi:hypothetical protein